MAKKDCQITLLDQSGRPTLYHPETNADQVRTGETYRVPEISKINNWDERSSELINARKGESSLKAKIDNIDTALQPSNLLLSIKRVDGAGSGLDADTVDGKTVNDEDTTTGSLWTANKIRLELNKKVDDTEVALRATPNKILPLNSSSKLEADLQGNAETSTRLKSPVEINLTGDVVGEFSLQGTEGTISVETRVDNYTHTHSKIENSGKAIEVGSENLVDFKTDGEIISSIDAEGNFSGSADKVNGVSVGDELITGSLWTSGKITEELDKVKQLFKDGVKVEQEQNLIEMGVLKIKYGEVALPLDGTTLALDIEEPFETMLFNSFSIETTDASLSCVKAPEETPQRITYILNKPALNGKLHWFAVGL